MKKAHKKALLWVIFVHPIASVRGFCTGFKRAYAELKQDGREQFVANMDQKKIAAEKAFDRIAEIKGF